MFLAYIATSPDKEDTARRGLLEEFRKLRESVVTPEELTQARTYAWIHGEGLVELTRFEEEMQAISAHDIRDMAAKFWDESRRVEGVVRGKTPG
jgi:zinc protease